MNYRSLNAISSVYRLDIPQLLALLLRFGFQILKDTDTSYLFYSFKDEVRCIQIIDEDD